MKISEFLSPADVLVNIRTADRNQLLQDVARKCAAKLDMPAEEVFSGLLKREQLGSTGMGNGVAIPHARFEAINKPFGMLVKLKPAIEFDAIDEQPVDLVFVLLLPAATEGEQLGALACVARKLRSVEHQQEFRRAKNSDELYAAFAGQ
jgi:PTS system nitrogen regulatory IIA component